MTARRAVWRWAWRMLRLDWRANVIIAIIITLAVAMSVGGALFAYHAVPSDDGLDAGITFTVQGDTTNEVERYLGQVEQRADLGRIERGRAKIAGSTSSLDIISVDSANPVVGSLVAIIAGREPVGPDEIALTDEAAAQLAAGVGDVVTLSDLTFTVSGLVENPTDLRSEFGAVDYRDPPAIQTSTLYKTLLTVDELESISFRGGLSVNEIQSTRSILAVVINAVVAMAMMLVGLLVSASFAVAARRRMRQFGLLGAIGAEPRHLRSAAAFSGFALGALAAVAGALLGALVAWAVLPSLEEALGHRIEFGLPVLFWLPAVLIAMAVAAIASWWPVRAMARQSITETLAARRPRRRPTRPVSTTGIVMIIVGYLLIGWALRTRDAGTIRLFLGMALSVVGVLLITPAAVTVLGRFADGSSLPLRIAGRDLSRFQGRSAAALGAIVLALAFPVGIGVVTASQDAHSGNEAPNLPADTAIVWAPGVWFDDGNEFGAPLDLSTEQTSASLDRVRAVDPSLRVTPITIPLDATLETWPNDQGLLVRRAHDALTPLDCNRPINGNSWSWDDDEGGPETCFRAQPMWIASTELAKLWGVDFGPAAVAGSVVTRFGVTEPSIYLLGPDSRVTGPPTERAALTPVAIPDHASFPNVLVTAQALGDEFDIVTIGWILTSNDPLTPRTVADLRSAMQGGTELETLSQPSSSTGLRTVAALVGLLVGLAVLASTVTLIRGESVHDQRTLTALGAAGGVTRSIAGYTAGLLAFGGALLALPLGYLALVVAQAASEDQPFAVPWSTLLIVVVIFPLAATAATALFTRVQADGLARVPVH